MNKHFHIMKSFIAEICILFFFNHGLLMGQTIIEGYIKDSQGEPIVGANVFIEGTFDGSSTDEEGLFGFITEARGDQILIASFIGYEEVRIPITIGDNPVSLHITMSEVVNQMDMVTITAGSFEAGGENKRTILKELDIVTTAGATADIAGVLNTLPGTQTVGEEGKLYVRGGEDYETKTFIDGMRVIKPYHTSVPYTPTRNRFSPFMFKGTSFSTGGYSAEFGQGLSSALILSTKERADQTRTDLTIIPFGGEVAQCLAGEKSSLAGKVGYFNMKPYNAIIPQNIDWIKAPESVEANLVLRSQIGKTGNIKAYGNFLWSTSALYQYDIDDPSMRTAFQMDNLYGYFNTSYKNIIGKKWSYFAGASYSSSDDRYSYDTIKIDDHTSGGQLKLAFSGDISKKIALNTGLDFFQRDHTFSYLNMADDNQSVLGFTEQILATFLEADIYFTNDFLARVGLRAEYGWLNYTFAIDPRISLAHKVGTYGNISFAYGHFRQATNDDLLRIANEVENEKSRHYILNYQYINQGKTFRIEGYYKQYRSLVKYDRLDMYNPLNYINSGEGYARGVDIFWRDSYGTIKNADYWISYSFLDTERDYRDYPEMAIPVFVSRHNISISYKQFFPRLKSFLSGTYTFASARPYNDPNSDGFNTGRTKCYNDLSASIAYMATDNIGLFFMCSNIPGFNNEFGYLYGSTMNEEGLYNRRAVIQPAKRFIIIGATITLSKNGVMNQLRTF
jgi:hypothetical protein